MREKKTYICELCNTEYTSRRDAKICEKNHVLAEELKVVKVSYDPPGVILSGRKNYPEKIVVEGLNGKRIEYVYNPHA